MRKIFSLLTVLLLVCCFYSGYAQDTGFYPVSPEIKIEIPSDKPLHLGEFCVVEYTVTGSVEDYILTFPEASPGFGYPLLLRSPHTGNIMRKREEGGHYVGNRYEFIYAFFPTQAGSQPLPTATIRMNGGIHTAEQKCMEVLPPKTGKLRDLKVQLVLPDEIRALQEFELSVIIEGDCTEEDQFAIIMPAATPWVLPGHQSNDHVVVHLKGKKEKGKQTCPVPLTIRKQGTYHVPGLYIANVKDNTYFPAGSVDIVVQEREKDPRDLVVTTHIPDTIWVGKPFTITHQLEGGIEKPYQLIYQKYTSEGLIRLDEPLCQYVGGYTYTGEENDSPVYKRRDERVVTYQLVDELMATQEGEIVIPSLKITFDDYKKYVIDSVVIHAIQPPEPFDREVSVKTTLPKMTLLGDKFWIEHKVEGFSGDLYSMDIGKETYEEMLSEDFKVVDRRNNINNRFLLSVGPHQYAVSSYSVYRWLLEPKRTGELEIPAFRVNLNGKYYSGGEQKIFVEE